MSLTREAFLKKAPVPKEEVPVPELGGSVWVHGMTAHERNNYEAQFFKRNGDPNKAAQKTYRQRLIVATAGDEDGTKWFTADDIDAIGQQPAVVIERIVDAARRVCGMTDADIESLAGNSQETGDD